MGKITAEISKLTKRANSQIEGLRLNSAEARAEMKKELLFAVRSMADEAKKNLDEAKKVAEAAFGATEGALAAAEKFAAKDRAKVAAQIATAKANAKVDAYAAQVAKEAEDVAALMKTEMDKLNGAIDAQKDQAKQAIGAAASKSAAQWDNAETQVQEALAAANEKTKVKFTKLYKDMADDRAEQDKNLADSFKTLNEDLAKQMALADSRFEHTVKDIAAARSEARDDVHAARKEFATRIATVTTAIQAMDTKLTGEVEVISAELISHQAMQARVNRHTQTEISRIDKLMNDQHSESKRARGKLRKILDENKRAAHDEVEALRTFFEGENSKIREKAEDDAEAASNDLTAATAKMYEAMADAQRTNAYENQESAKAIGAYSAESLAAIAASKKNFNQRLDQLTNTIAANAKHVEDRFEKLTDVIRMHKATGAEDRKLIQEQNEAMGRDMKRKIRTAIQEGEAKAKAVANRAEEALNAAKKTLLVEITDTVEDFADKTFAAVQGSHAKIADNYLSLKAYAVTAEEKVVAYVGQGKGKNLSSLGDLLVNIAALSDVEVEKEEGLSPSGELPKIFSSGTVEVDNSISKINGLVHEYISTVNACRMRWPMGLGKYLLEKLEGSMEGKGVLQVDKVDSKSGNWVFMNGHAVGLSNKLNDFEGPAVRMGHYEAQLAKLTAALSGKAKKPVKPTIHYASPPEYKGD